MAWPAAVVVSRGIRSASPARPRSADLYDRCRRDDESAWTEVYARALAAVKRRRASQAEAEDIAGDTVIKLLEVLRSGTVKDPVAFPAYIGIVAVHLFYDRRRSPAERDRVWSDPANLTIRAPEPSPAATAAARQRFAIFLSALRRLPVACQEVLRAYFQHIHLDPKGSYRTLVNALRSNRGAVSSRVTRCMGELLEDTTLRDMIRGSE